MHIYLFYDHEEEVLGERPYPVIKKIYHDGHVFVTTVPRVRVKAMFVCLGHNLFNLLSLRRRGMITYTI